MRAGVALYLPVYGRKMPVAQTIDIASRDNEHIKQAKKLSSDAAARTAAGLFFAEGLKLCLDIAAQIEPAEVYYTLSAMEKEPRIASLTGTHYAVSESVAEKLAQGKSNQGLFCLFPFPAPWNQTLTEASRVLLLDGVQDPGNVGAALRSAAAFGWDAAVLGEGCADPYSPKALRSGMSATVKLPLLKTENLSACVSELQKNGCLCAAARLEEAVDMHQITPDGAFGLVIGSEGRGVSRQVAQACAKSVYIPIASQMESLNAAVAAGVLMFYYRP